MRHIFVSYARENKAFVDKLAADLRAAGYTLWLDREREAELATRAVWQEAVVAAIEQCSAFLWVLSEQSAQSDAVWSEYSIAKEEKKPLILVQCGAIKGKMPGRVRFVLTSKQRIDFFNESYERARETLIQTLNKVGGTPVVEEKERTMRGKTQAADLLGMPSFLLRPVFYGRWKVENIVSFFDLIVKQRSYLGVPRVPRMSMLIAIREDGTFNAQVIGEISNAEGTWIVLEPKTLRLRSNRMRMRIDVVSMLEDDPLNMSYTFNTLSIDDLESSDLISTNSEGQRIKWTRVS